MGLDLSRLKHPLVAGPVIPEEGVRLDQLVQGDEGGEQLTEFLENNLEREPHYLTSLEITRKALS